MCSECSEAELTEHLEGGQPRGSAQTFKDSPLIFNLFKKLNSLINIPVAEALPDPQQNQAGKEKKNSAKRKERSLFNFLL